MMERKEVFHLFLIFFIFFILLFSSIITLFDVYYILNTFFFMCMVITY